MKCLGASNHTNEERAEYDFYATDPKAIDILCAVEHFDGDIWEPACGQGHLSERLIKHGYSVISSDLIDRGYGTPNIDFFQCNKAFDGNIITNPPFNHADKFIIKALELIPSGNKVAMFLKLQFLEGKKRKLLFAKYPPKTIYVSSSRLHVPKTVTLKDMVNATRYVTHGMCGKRDI